MANDDWNELDDESGDGSELVKKLRAQLKQANKRNSELEDQMSGLSKSVRQREVKDVLEARGVNPKIARFILNDVENPTEESVSEWLTENGEFFGVQAQPTGDTNPEGVTAEDLEALKAIGAFTNANAPAGGSKTAELESAVAKAENSEELMRLLGNPGGGVIPFLG